MSASATSIREVLCALPTAPCVMGSAFEGRRFGVFVTRVATVADEPPCVAVALRKGQRLATYIRDSHSFSLSILAPSQRLLIKKFRESHLSEADPFDTVEARTLTTGAPVLLRALAGIDCDVMRHFDLEADHEMYVGQVVDVAVLNAAGLRGADAASAAGATIDAEGSALEVVVNRTGNGHAHVAHVTTPHPEGGVNGNGRVNTNGNGNGKHPAKRPKQSPALDPRNQHQ